MGTAITITNLAHSSSSLRQLSARTKSAAVARRLLALALLLDGRSRTEAALQCGMQRQTLRDWVHRYNAARDLDKRIELVMRGAETELDRQVLELIKDPLTHMVRNSGDHGLEKPEVRRAAGKPETGRITLNAYHEGGHIIIEVADDGTGLHVDRILAKLLSKGLASESELAAMSGTDIQRFIFHAGFSTAAQVTAVSGRGVGMDVVKTNIEKIGGTIDIKSDAGRGTTFTIKIPLTLAIVSALIVEAGGERFAIPQISVVELVRARLNVDSRDNTTPVVEHIQGTPVLRLRDQLLPLVNLTDLLGLSSSKLASASPGHAEHSAHVVVVQVGSALLGIIVDRVFDTEEIVVKPVAPILRHITMFSGNTTLGDGSVIMILDPNGIARATGVAGSSGGDRVRDSRDSAMPSPRSSTSNAMLLFRAGGAEPKAVPLGLVARLEDLPRDKIEMSGGQPVTQYRGRLIPLVPLAGSINADAERHAVLAFDGHALVRQLRAAGAWAKLPIIALTSHTSPDSIDAARDAGFTDYVAKFEREALLASLQQCLAAAPPAGGRRLAPAA